MASRIVVFDWPDGLELGVRAWRRESEEVLGMARHWASESRYRVSTSRSTGGWHLGVSDFERQVLAHAQPTSGPDVRLHLDRVKDEMLDLQLDEDGQLVGVVGVEGFRERMSPAHDPMPQTDPLLVASVERLLSESALRQICAGPWNAWAGTWVAHEIEEGMEQEFEFDEPMPLLGGHPLPMRASIGCLGTEGDVAHLFCRSQITPSGLRMMLDALGVGPLRGVSFEECEWINMAQVRTVVDSLIPLEAAIQSRRKTLVHAPGEGLHYTVAEEGRSWEFTVLGEYA